VLTVRLSGNAVREAPILSAIWLAAKPLGRFRNIFNYNPIYVVAVLRQTHVLLIILLGIFVAATVQNLCDYWLRIGVARTAQTRALQ